MFIEANMTSNVDTLGLRVEASIAVMESAIAKKNARDILRIHFIGIIRPKMRITLASEDTKEREIGFVFK